MRGREEFHFPTIGVNIEIWGLGGTDEEQQQKRVGRHFENTFHVRYPGGVRLLRAGAFKTTDTPARQTLA